MRTLLVALALLLPFAAFAGGPNISKLNGGIQIDAGQLAGNLRSVNGAVQIGDRAVVEKVGTVNGAVTLGAQVRATELGTVNGAIRIGAGSQITGKVHAVNGAITLAQGAQVDGHLSNVNGAIRLDGAHVAGGIETVAGNITVGAGSRVEGGILVNKPGNFRGNEREPVIVIGPHAVVQGTLVFERPVVLQVSDSAQIGAVQGATVQKFSGATP